MKMAKRVHESISYSFLDLKNNKQTVQILIILVHNTSLLRRTLLAFVKEFYIWIYFVICFISKWYAQSWEIFFVVLSLNLYISTNMGTFSLEIIYIFLLRRSLRWPKCYIFFVLLWHSQSQQNNNNIYRF